MVELWNENKTYNKNDVVVYINHLWECTTDDTTSIPCSINDTPISPEVSGSIIPSLDKTLKPNTGWKTLEETLT